MKRSTAVNLTVMGGIMAATTGIDLLHSGWNCRQAGDYDNNLQCITSGRFPSGFCSAAFDRTRQALVSSSTSGVRISRNRNGDVSAVALTRPTPGGAWSPSGETLFLGSDRACRSGSGSSSASSSSSSRSSYGGSSSGGSSSGGDHGGSESHSSSVSRGGFGAMGHAFSSSGG